MTDYEAHLDDAANNESDIVTIDCPPMPETPQRHAVAVFDFHHEGMHFIVTPFTVPDDFTMEIVAFDRDGHEMASRVMSVRGLDITFGP